MGSSDSPASPDDDRDDWWAIGAAIPARRNEFAVSDLGENPTLRDAIPRPDSYLRRVGAVLGLTGTDILVWINGVTEDAGVWIKREHVPASLHSMEATFDVWLADGQSPEVGAYRAQLDPATGRPYEDSEIAARELVVPSPQPADVDAMMEAAHALLTKIAMARNTSLVRAADEVTWLHEYQRHDPSPRAVSPLTDAPKEPQ